MDENYLSRKGYFLSKKKLNNRQLSEVKKDLSIRPISKTENSQYIKHYVDLDSHIIIPRKYGEQKFGKVELQNMKIKKIELTFKGELRKEQEKPYEILKKHIETNGSGIFSLMTGKGKTVCAIKLISDFGLRTLIISASVNQVDMLKQWKRELERFVPGASLGLLQGKVIDYKNKDIILSTISSLSSKDYPASYFSGIGLVIIDECFVPWQKIITDSSILTIYTIYTKFMNNEQIFVKAYDQNTKKICSKRVTYAWEKESTSGLYRLTLSDGSEIDCTPNHKFLLQNDKWKTAQELEIGDCFLYMGEMRNFICLKGKFFYDIKIKVYDLEVEDVHNYILDSGIIAHNCHHISSPKYSEILYKIGGSPYFLALSATPERQDGLTQILKWWTGDTFYSQSGEFNGLNPQVLTFVLNSKDYKELFMIFRGRETIAFTSMLSDLISMKNRNLLLADLLVLLSKTDRQILLVSDRIEHIKILCSLLEKRIDKNIFSAYIGTQMKEEQKKEAMTKKIILATSKSFGEGIDKKELDTLILATPKKYVSENTDKKIYASISFPQIIGRIFRKSHEVNHPLIIDLFDNFSVYKNQGYSRNRFYNNNLKGSQIKKIDIDLDSYDTRTKKINSKMFLFPKNLKSIHFSEQEENTHIEQNLLSDSE